MGENSYETGITGDNFVYGEGGGSENDDSQTPTGYYYALFDYQSSTIYEDTLGHCGLAIGEKVL